MYFGHSEQSGRANVKNVYLEKGEAVRDMPEKVTWSQIQGGQVKKLGLYSVDLRCLGQRNAMMTSML